jgi:predicted RND superfamily exporter protein
MAIGIAACVTAALLVLPALLRLLMHWGWTMNPDRRHRGKTQDKS